MLHDHEDLSLDPQYPKKMFWMACGNKLNTGEMEAGDSLGFAG